MLDKRHRVHGYFHLQPAPCRVRIRYGVLQPPTCGNARLAVTQVASVATLSPFTPYRSTSWDEGMRGSEIYRRYLDKISAIASANATAPGWEMRVESVVNQFHLETMAMVRGAFRDLRDEMAADLENSAKCHYLAPAREVYSLAARLVRSL